MKNEHPFRMENEDLGCMEDVPYKSVTWTAWSYWQPQLCNKIETPKTVHAKKHTIRTSDNFGVPLTLDPLRIKWIPSRSEQRPHFSFWKSKVLDYTPYKNKIKTKKDIYQPSWSQQGTLWEEKPLRLPTPRRSALESAIQIMQAI